MEGDRDALGGQWGKIEGGRSRYPSITQTLQSLVLAMMDFCNGASEGQPPPGELHVIYAGQLIESASHQDRGMTAVTEK